MYDWELNSLKRSLKGGRGADYLILYDILMELAGPNMLQQLHSESAILL